MLQAILSIILNKLQKKTEVAEMPIHCAVLPSFLKNNRLVSISIGCKKLQILCLLCINKHNLTTPMLY